MVVPGSSLFTVGSVYGDEVRDWVGGENGTLNRRRGRVGSDADAVEFGVSIICLVLAIVSTKQRLERRVLCLCLQTQGQWGLDAYRAPTTSLNACSRGTIAFAIP